MNYIVIDAETYWAQDYTLTTMTPEAYIRDARFKDHGWGVMPIGGEPRWITPQQLRKMADRYDWSDTAIICHNTRFDGAILGWHYGIKPRMWFDTMGMYRALYPYLRSYSLGNLGKHFEFGAKGNETVNTKGRWELSSAEMAALGEYCKQDCIITARLFTHAIHRFPPFARMVMDMTLRMFIEPILEVDRPILEKFLVEHVADKARTLEACGLDRDQVMSNDKFADALRTLGIEPPTKSSPSNPEKRIFAFAKTDKALNELADHDDPQVQILVAARLANKSTLLETRTKHVIEIGKRGTIPIPLNYWGAKTTGRHSGGDKLNMQNFTRGSILRKGIVAPPGYKIVVGDSSNIELRLVMAAAGQLDAVDKLRSGIDLYSDFATDIYGRTITKADEDERFVGKQGMLSLQYQAGAPRFCEMMRQKKHPIPLDEAERVKTVYRKKHRKVVDLWYHCEEHILPAIAGGITMQSLDVNGWLLTNDMGFSLPGELGVQYKDLTKTPDGWKYASSFGSTDIFGAQVVENMCIAAGSLVLTEFGWKPIEEVTREDRVHDGENFVVHGGLVDKSTKHCVTIDGIHMTPDHEVLTDEGWKTASQNPRPFRPNIRRFDRLVSGVRRWEESALGIPLRLWHYGGEDRGAGDTVGGEGRHTKLRVYDSRTYVGECCAHTQHVKAPGVLGMAFHARQVQVAVTSGVEKLRGAWHQGVHSLGEVFRSVLGRHGQHVLAGFDVGSHQQQQGVQSEQLPVGDAQRQQPQQAEQLLRQHHAGADASVGSDAAVGGKPHHADVAASEGLAPGEDAPASAGERQVYDLMDCGPLNRFVVLGESGPFIVHNCQHLAYNVVMYQALLVQTRYRVVHSVHDELVCCVKEDEAEDCAAFMLQCLRTAPKWAGDLLPVTGEVGIGDSYGEAK